MRTLRLHKNNECFSRRSLGIAALVMVWVWCTLAGTGWAAEITVSASVQPAATTVGEPVQLAVAIKGTQNARRVPTVQVEGAQVQYLGPAMQTTLNNSELSVTMTHRYYLIPQKAGELMIPAIEVEVDGSLYYTVPVALRVSPPGQANAPDVNQGSFIEVEIPRRPIYVGEAFPVEVRLLVPSEVRWRIESMPDFSSDSFLKTQFQQPQQKQDNRNGRAYDVLTFKTILTAIKSGDVPIGEISFRIQMASPKKKERGASPFGGIFDGFPFDAQPTTLQERTLTFNDGRMQVLELPSEGKPESFRGAVGRFRFAVGSNQPKIKVGEPLTMNLQIEGEGNLDRIEVPPMVNPDGWRVYPPETSIAKGDESGRRGVKSFRLAVVPEMAHQKTPQFEFSYFDTEAGKYVTQVSAPVPLEVQGSLPAVAKPQPAPAVAPEAQAPTVVQAPASILEEGDVTGKARQMWTSSPVFWKIQGAVAGLIAIFGVARWVRQKREHEGPGPLLRKEANTMAARLRSDAEGATFWRDAIRVLQLRVAAKTGQPVAAIGVEEVLRELRFEPGDREDVVWLFERDSESRFAGQGDGLKAGKEEQARVLAILERSAR